MNLASGQSSRSDASNTVVVVQHWVPLATKSNHYHMMDVKVASKCCEYVRITQHTFKHTANVARRSTVADVPLIPILLHQHALPAEIKSAPKKEYMRFVCVQMYADSDRPHTSTCAFGRSQ